ncbi:protein of unknown function (plasmid) [Thermococcus nautili]|nr:protein of unknown function [Thermococcus nautili]
MARRSKNPCASCSYYSKGFCGLIRLNVYGRVRHCYSRDVEAKAEDLVNDIISYIKQTGEVKAINVAKAFGLTTHKVSGILDKMAKAGVLKYYKHGNKKIYYLPTKEVPKENLAQAIELVSQIFPFSGDRPRHYSKSLPEHERYEFYLRLKKMQVVGNEI